MTPKTLLQKLLIHHPLNPPFSALSSFLSFPPSSFRRSWSALWSLFSTLLPFAVRLLPTYSCSTRSLALDVTLCHHRTSSHCSSFTTPRSPSLPTDPSTTRRPRPVRLYAHEMVPGLTSSTTLTLLALLPLLSAVPIEPEPLHVLKVRKIPNRRDEEVRSDTTSLGFRRLPPPPPLSPFPPPQPPFFQSIILGFGNAAMPSLSDVAPHDGLSEAS
jgi:hypothetical protein